MEGGELYQVSRGKGSSCSKIIAIKETEKIPLLQCSAQMVWLDIPYHRLVPHEVKVLTLFVPVLMLRDWVKGHMARTRNRRRTRTR